jgi:hypothetical protein
MDFTRSEQSNQAAGPRPTTGSAKPSKNKGSSKKLLRYATGVLLISVAVIVIGLIGLFVFTKSDANQNKYVNTKQMQAVFLNGGQVYFGNITSLNGRFIAMSNIYYLRVNQTVQPNTSTTNANDVSLVKLGCELHGPQDQMVINQSQVIFWENLKGDGQVAKAVAQFKQQNPNGQNCSAAAAKQ